MGFQLWQLIVVVAAIIVIYSLIRWATKVAVKVLGVLLSLAIVIFVLFYWRGGLVNLHKEHFPLFKLHQKYCIDKADPVKCDCIIEPVFEDISESYDVDELDGLSERANELNGIVKALRKEARKQSSPKLEEDLRIKEKELQNIRLKFSKITLKALAKNRREIKQCLKERDSEHVWGEFIDELQDQDGTPEWRRKLDELAK